MLILKHESKFSEVNNPTEGTYYIEHLTKQLAEKALKLFKDIEKEGGFLELLKSGIIQRKIKEHAQKEQESFNVKEQELVGIHVQQNRDEKMKFQLELYPFLRQMQNFQSLFEAIFLDIFFRYLSRFSFARLSLSSPACCKYTTPFR